MEAVESNGLLAKCPDGGQSLESGGDVGVHWTTSCKYTKMMV